MPAGKTYVKIASQTLSGSVSSVTFSNLPQNYTDLVLVMRATDNRGGGSLADGAGITFNSDTSTASTNYSFTYVGARSSGTDSGRNSNFREIDVYAIGTGNGSSTFSPIVCNIMNYSNSTTYKTVLARGGNVLDITSVNVGLWRSTAPITSITIWPGYNGAGYTFTSGSIFTIYGIEAAKTLKADGGDVYFDGAYFYHVFKTSGVFFPRQSVTCDYLIVAGGGGGGGQQAGGGGAGGVRAFTSQSLTVTPYAVTVGAGGVGGKQDSNTGRTSGGNTTFNSTSVTGGGYGAANTGGGNAGSGGSGGGGGINGTVFGNGNAGGYSPAEGNNGGAGASSGNGGGGGGGAGAAGTARQGNGDGGNGGAGTDTYNSINFSSWLTATGTGSSTKVGGGGGGGTNSTNTAGSGGVGGGGAGYAGDNPIFSYTQYGTANTGGGGGGGSQASNGYGIGGNGGSGLVIVRYLA